MRYVVVSAVSGIVFGVLDGVINANPLARQLNAAYKPIARRSINPLAGVAIDLAYGFILAGLFLILYESLPGGAGLAKGVSFGLLAWFFRVVMDAAAHGVMFRVPPSVLLYSVATGLGEMLVLGTLYGLTLRPLP